MVLMALGQVLKGQTVADELKAIEAAYDRLEGLSGVSVTTLHALKADGSAGSVIEETQGRMVWTRTLKYEEMGGLRRIYSGGRAVLVDTEERRVTVSGDLPTSTDVSRIPAFSKPAEQMLKEANASALLPVRDGLSVIRLTYSTGSFASINFHYRPDSYVLQRVEMEVRATADEPAMLLVTEMKDMVANPQIAPAQYSTESVVVEQGGRLTLTAAYQNYQLIQL